MLCVCMAAYTNRRQRRDAMQCTKIVSTPCICALLLIANSVDLNVAYGISYVHFLKCPLVEGHTTHLFEGGHAFAVLCLKLVNYCIQRLGLTLIEAE